MSDELNHLFHSYIQWAKSFQCKVIGTAGTNEGSDLVLKNGADFVVNHRDADYVDKIMAYTSGKGVDVILEMLANQNLAKDLSMIAFKGRIAVIGNRGTIEINPRDAMSKRATIFGVMLYNYTQEEKNELNEAHQKSLKEGKLKPVIGKAYPLAQVQQGHIDIIAHSGGSHGKLILRPWE
jgi:NADPH2:quinone reductase